MKDLILIYTAFYFGLGARCSSKNFKRDSGPSPSMGRLSLLKLYRSGLILGQVNSNAKKIDIHIFRGQHLAWSSGKTPSCVVVDMRQVN